MDAAESIKPAMTNSPDVGRLGSQDNKDSNTNEEAPAARIRVDTMMNKVMPCTRLNGNNGLLACLDGCTQECSCPSTVL
jgi:hypothetical protein